MTDAQRLAEAQAAYHSLLTGTMARVVVDQNGERVEFATAKRAELYAYIQELIGITTTPTLGCPSNAPLSFLF